MKARWKWLWVGTVVFAFGFSPEPVHGQSWQIKRGTLLTRWAEEVSPTNSHPEYPRPQMVRTEWRSLNGLWDFAVLEQAATQPSRWQGSILVPFPIESSLSGVARNLSETQRLWYHRTFSVPTAWRGRRVLLHFGAVDWESTVWINGKEMGTHRGGYDAFTFDITGALKSGGEQEIVVAVRDPSDHGNQARGKQTSKPHRTWYSTCSGIWQSVWLEPVDATSIDAIQVVPDLDNATLQLTLQTRGSTNHLTVEVIALDAGNEVSRTNGSAGATIRLGVPNPKLWSPDSPFLYDLKLALLENGKRVDQVTSYFGMRKISVVKDSAGIPRLCLNNQVLFQFGPLDQGYWPDGIYTAPTDAALRYDIEVTKQLGCNVCRKHVKVEPERWYSWCDKLGLLVWQDMPNGAVGYAGQDTSRSDDEAAQFERELRAMVEGRSSHPCIVMWIVFNQNWGQFDTERLTRMVKQLDPSRLVLGASGWIDRNCGDVKSAHNYPWPAAPEIEPDRVAVVGEFGGVGLEVENHTWSGTNWSYLKTTSPEMCVGEYLKVMNGLMILKSAGLAGAIYTQLTDVEVENNGFMTYDRSVLKIEPEKVRERISALVDRPNDAAPATRVASLALNGDPGTSDPAIAVAPPEWLFGRETQHEEDDPATLGDPSGRRLSIGKICFAIAILLGSGAWAFTSQGSQTRREETAQDA